ncbi:glycosyltransferase [Robertmurraya beringensis]|uniref:Glycosyltransferase n=1 Tax=Robertmurraya beringensis TaxID=641660 RepID=A0ABV6KS20_9BACI
MKKIAIVTRKLVMGGIERALASKLENLCDLGYDVTLFLMSPGGELENSIPSNIKVEYIFGTERSVFEKVLKNVDKGKYYMAAKVLFCSLCSKITKTVFNKEFYLSKVIEPNETVYDLAIAYHTPASFPVVYVINNLKANKKIAWIHSDVSVYKNELKPYRKYYQRFDHIFCVSKFGKDKFIGMYPELEQKTSVFYNIINRKNIIEKSNFIDGFQDEFQGIRILTVGRLCNQKGQDIIPEIMINLLKEGHEVKWYCIGEGEDRDKIDNLIKQHNLQNNLILLGNKINPYPYFRECDIYVQPSRHEGYCISLAEARIFNKPIVTTNFVGALEQIKNGHTGIIVEFNAKKLVLAIQELVEKKNIREKFEINLLNDQNDNSSQMKLLLNMI